MFSAWRPKTKKSTLIGANLVVENLVLTTETEILLFKTSVTGLPKEMLGAAFEVLSQISQLHTLCYVF